MRLRVLLAAAALFLTASAMPVEAAPEPVGSCSSDATVEVCVVQCIQPPCPHYVCVNLGGQRICRLI